MGQKTVIKMGRNIAIERETFTEVKINFHVKIDGEKLREMLKNAGIFIPPGATVQFMVPGGGDWSNMAVDIDEENPVHIQWTTSEVK